MSDFYPHYILVTLPHCKFDTDLARRMTRSYGDNSAKHFRFTSELIINLASEINQSKNSYLEYEGLAQNFEYTKTAKLIKSVNNNQTIN